MSDIEWKALGESLAAEINGLPVTVWPEPWPFAGYHVEVTRPVVMDGYVREEAVAITLDDAMLDAVRLATQEHAPTPAEARIAALTAALATAREALALTPELARMSRATGVYDSVPGMLLRGAFSAADYAVSAARYHELCATMDAALAAIDAAKGGE